MNVTRQSLKDIKAISNMVRGLQALAVEVGECGTIDDYKARLHSEADKLRAEVAGLTAARDELAALKSEIKARRAELDGIKGELAEIRGRFGG